MKITELPETKLRGFKFATDRVEEFKTAAEAEESLQTFFQTFLSYSIKAKDDLENLRMEIANLSNCMITVLNNESFKEAEKKIHQMTLDIEEQLEDIVYYHRVWEFARDWIDRRAESIKDGTTLYLVIDLRNDILAIREIVLEYTKSFVERINFLNRLTNVGDNEENNKTWIIKDTVKKLNNQLQELGLFTEVTDNVIPKIKQLSQ